MLNKIKTVLLLGILSGILLLLGSYFGGQFGLQFALAFSLIMNGIMYFYSETIVLKMYRAQKLDENNYQYIYQMVESLAKDMAIPMPKLWIVNNQIANAFATGRNPHHASIVITSGILSILDNHELRAVLAHELAHIKNRDVLIATIAATLATAIGYIAHMLRWATFWGTNKRRRGNPLFMIIVALIMPIAATLIQLAISRSREYQADETGAQHSCDPLSLASALKKLHNSVPQHHFKKDSQYASTASLFIVNPFVGQWVSLFSTHPPMEKRIARLEKIYEKMF